MSYVRPHLSWEGINTTIQTIYSSLTRKRHTSLWVIEIKEFIKRIKSYTIVGAVSIVWSGIAIVQAERQLRRSARCEVRVSKDSLKSLTNSNVDKEVGLQEEVMPSPQSCTLCPGPGKATRDDTGNRGGKTQDSTTPALGVRDWWQPMSLIVPGSQHWSSEHKTGCSFPSISKTCTPFSCAQLNQETHGGRGLCDKRILETVVIWVKYKVTVFGNSIRFFWPIHACEVFKDWMASEKQWTPCHQLYSSQMTFGRNAISIKSN